MGRRRSPGHEVNRERILANAVRAFGEVGYPSATMAQLAQACGTSKAGLYHYYASKESLLFDALDQYTRRLISLAREVFDRGLPPQAQLAELVRVFVDEYRHSRDYHVALLNDVKFLAEPQRDAIRAQEREVVLRFRDALTAAFPERMRSEAAMPTTMALLGMINFTFAWLRPDGPLTHGEFADLVIRLWEHGLSGPAPVRNGAARPPRGTGGDAAHDAKHEPRRDPDNHSRHTT